MKAYAKSSKVFPQFRAACALALALAGGQAVAADLQPVRVVLPSYALTTITALTAHDEGLDHQAGLDFVFSQSPGSIGVKAMLAGDFDFSMSPGAVATAAVSGAPVRVIGIHIGKSFNYLYAKKEFKTVKDLNGKSLGIGAIGDSTDIAARAALLKGGADVTSINFVSMGIDNVPPALIAGALDAGVVIPPRDILMDRTGKFTNMGFLGDYLPTPSSGFATTKKMIESNPELVQRFTNVLMKASQLLQSNRDVAVKELMKYMKLSKEDAETAYQRYMPMFTKDGAIDEAAQQAVIEDQLKTVKVRGKPTPADVFDMQFVKKAK